MSTMRQSRLATQSSQTHSKDPASNLQMYNNRHNYNLPRPSSLEVEDALQGNAQYPYNILLSSFTDLLTKDLLRFEGWQSHSHS